MTHNARDRIATFLQENYGLSTSFARDHADRLIRECGLGPALRSVSPGLKGDQPRQTFGGEPKTL